MAKRKKKAGIRLPSSAPIGKPSVYAGFPFLLDFMRVLSVFKMRLLFSKQSRKPAKNHGMQHEMQHEKGGRITAPQFFNSPE